MVDGERIDEGFDGRSDLPLALLGHVVLEIAEVGAADIRLDIPRAGIERHERRAHDPFVVQDRIARGHQRVALAPVREDLHRTGFVERRHDLFRARPGILHLAVAIRITDGMPHDPLPLLARRVDEEGLRIAVLRVHTGLDHALHLLLHGLFGIFLHRRVDRRVDLQPVAVDVVGRTVGLAVLAAPAVERVFLVLLHGLVVIPFGVELVALGPLGVHHKAQHLAEIGRRALVMRHGLVVEHDRQGADRVALLACQRPGILHARKHQVPPREGVLGVAHGRIPRRGVHHPHQHGRLLHVQFVRLLVEEGLRRRLDAIGVRAVFDRIEVHGGDLLLRIVVFELQRRDPLLEFRHDEFRRTDDTPPVAHRVAREKVLGQLLRDGRTAALRRILQQHGFHRHTCQRRDVDPRMGAETGVFGCDQRRDDRRHVMPVEPDVECRIGREKVFVLHIRTVLHEEGTDHLAVLGVDFGGQVAARVLQLLERRHAPEQPQGRQQQHDRQQRKGCEDHPPYPFYRFRADARLFPLCHRPEICAKDTKFITIRTAAPRPRPTRRPRCWDGRPTA